MKMVKTTGMTCSKNDFFKNEKINFDCDSIARDCFGLYDNGSKGYLDENDFHDLTLALFSDETKPIIEESNEFFHSFDKNRDKKIDFCEFKELWNSWIKKLLCPITALIVVDVQNDFIDGTLALKNCPAKQDANDIIPVLNNLIENFSFDVVVYTLDQHPKNHISFYKNLKNYPLHTECQKNLTEVKLFDTVTFAGPGQSKVKQKLWPAHCVEGTWGAKLHSKLKVPENAVMIIKGMTPVVDSYSAFYDNMHITQTNLHKELQQRQVTHVFICGIAYDVCVFNTVLDALSLGYATTVVKDATSGINLKDIDNKTKELKEKYAVISYSDKLDKLLCRKNVRLEFAKTLKNCI